jgi:hypothetical protein
MKIAGRTVPLRIHAILDDYSRYIVAVVATTNEREIEMLALLASSNRSPHADVLSSYACLEAHF